jgi:two-component system response regulator
LPGSSGPDFSLTRINVAVTTPYPAPILVAEDEETDVILLRLAFKKAGLATELIVAHDGREVIEYLDQNPPWAGAGRPFPGVLLLDLKMPRMSGFEVLDWLRGQPRFEGLPVLIFSSSNHESDVERALEMGAREYLVKPHAIQDLVSLLRDVHERYITLSNKGK